MEDIPVIKVRIGSMLISLGLIVNATLGFLVFFLEALSADLAFVLVHLVSVIFFLPAIWILQSAGDKLSDITKE